MQTGLIKIFFAFIIITLISCGGSSDNNSLKSEPKIPVHPDTPQAIAMRAVCMGCHQMDVQTIGPSIKDLSAKYKASDISRLVATVKAGRSPGELTWGNNPKPESYLPEEDIQKVIEWMLTQ